MKMTTVAIALIMAFAIPAAASADSGDDHQRAAQKQCTKERGKSPATREAFKAKYHSMSRCVKREAAEEEREDKRAHKNAAQECRDERKTLGNDAFNEEYGTNGNKRNAFGKCVSKKAKEKKAEMDAEDAEEVAERKHAARECAAEREDMGREAFAEEYGTNENKKNAFGKCVSGKAREQ
jgi:hypothetical protein